MNNDLVLLKLRKDVEIFVKDQIENIKFVNEILAINYFKNVKPNLPYDYQSYSFLLKFKKILQLMLNLNNAFEIFKHREVQFTLEESTFIKDFYQYDTNSGTWKCIDRPKETHIVEALYNYILCYRSLEMCNEECDPNCKLGVIENVDCHRVRCCPFCESEVSPTADNCYTCNALVTEMDAYSSAYTLLGNVRNTPGNEEGIKEDIDRVDGRDVAREESVNVGGDNFGMQEMEGCRQEGRGKDENDSLGCSRINESIKTEEAEGSTWKCEKCDCLNMDDFLSCKVCSENRIVESGGGCEPDSGSGMASGVCDATDQWKCGECGREQSCKAMRCCQCKAERTVSGRWTCLKCTFVNKCCDVMCDACAWCNEGLCVKYCKMCVRNTVAAVDDVCNGCVKMKRDQSIMWQCRYEGCKAWSCDGINYCYKCSLWRHGSRIRGDPIKKLCGDKEKSIWSCHRCYHHNELTDSVCSSLYCNETRYHDKYCHNCHRFNGGMSLNCEKCYRRL